MEFLKVLESIRNHGVIVKIFDTGKILFKGKVRDIPTNFKNEGWLVREVRLTDVNNYNSDYILTIY